VLVVPVDSGVVPGIPVVPVVAVAMPTGGLAKRRLGLAHFVTCRPPGRSQILPSRPPAGGRCGGGGGGGALVGPVHILPGPVDRGPDVPGQ
jgi:hypothetical protein